MATDFPRSDVSPSRQERLDEFFRRYAILSFAEDPAKLAELYDGSFLAAGPNGGAAFKNDDSFLAWLREVHAFNARAEMTSLTVGEIREITVGAGYSLATVLWSATFQRTGATPIRFTISYLLREADSRFRVAAYISHDDQESVMRAHGLL